MDQHNNKTQYLTLRTLSFNIIWILFSKLDINRIKGDAITQAKAPTYNMYVLDPDRKVGSRR